MSKDLIKTIITVFLLSLISICAFSNEGLKIISISSSSELMDRNIKGRYSVANTIDGDSATSWSEGVEGSGIEHWINYTFLRNTLYRRQGASYIDGIKIVPGFGASDEIFKENNRIKQLEIIIIHGYPENVNGVIDEKTKISKETFNIPDKNEPFILRFNKSYAVISIYLKIKKVYKGEIWDDTCISEVSFLNGDNLLKIENIQELTNSNYKYFKEVDYGKLELEIDCRQPIEHTDIMFVENFFKVYYNEADEISRIEFYERFNKISTVVQIEYDSYSRITNKKFYYNGFYSNSYDYEYNEDGSLKEVSANVITVK